jgi:hypothetical protein
MFLSTLFDNTTAAAAGDQTRGPFSYNIKKRNYHDVYANNPYMLLLYQDEQKKQRLARPTTPPLPHGYITSSTQTPTTRSNHDDEHKEHD